MRYMYPEDSFKSEFENLDKPFYPNLPIVVHEFPFSKISFVLIDFIKILFDKHVL